MSLTRSELKTIQAAKLDRLVAELMAALRGNDVDALDAGLQALVDYQAATPFPDLQLAAAKAHSAAAEETVNVALDGLADAATRIAFAGAGFKAAAAIAESGKKELFFPALAAASAQSLELIQQFQATLDKVIETVGDVEQLGDVPDAVAAVVDSLETLKDTIDAVE